MTFTNMSGHNRPVGMLQILLRFLLLFLHIFYNWTIESTVACDYTDHANHHALSICISFQLFSGEVDTIFY